MGGGLWERGCWSGLCVWGCVGGGGGGKSRGGRKAGGSGRAPSAEAGLRGGRTRVQGQPIARPGAGSLNLHTPPSIGAPSGHSSSGVPAALSLLAPCSLSIAPLSPTPSSMQPHLHAGHLCLQGDDAGQDKAGLSPSPLARAALGQARALTGAHTQHLGEGWEGVEGPLLRELRKCGAVHPIQHAQADALCEHCCPHAAHAKGGGACVR